ncbi:glutamate receptor-like [Mytilus californianus]|uniref:glutamate receptor-like n=1 Tax=Mytilus californianus TaxID=6549 RepID=UPI0022465EA8|nr:glutamate receptor-like [Mytilus californianus]
MGSISSIFVFVLLWINSSSGQNYTITSVLEDPYLIDNGDGTFSGFMIDLLDALSKGGGFSYEIGLNPDDKYGSQDGSGNWDGMIGEVLQDPDIQIAAAPILITDERKSAVPFTRPFLNVGHRIVIKKPVVKFQTLSVLFEPFSLQLWIMVIVICFIVSALLFIVNKFSPSEWSRIRPEDDPTNAKDSFSANNAFFFVHSTLTWQGYKEVPRSPAGRILVTMWFSFIFFMVIAYIANLTAFFLARETEKPVVPFKTWQEMTTQSNVLYGVKPYGVMHRSMKVSKDPILQHAIQTIETYSTTFSSSEDGIKRVRESDGSFAAIVPVDEGSKYINNEPCDLMFVGANIVNTPYGMACKSVDICNRLTVALIEEAELGGLYLLEQKWLSPKSNYKCPAASLENYISKQETARLSARPLTIADASLAFVVLLIGIVFCIIFLVIEVIIHRRRKMKSTRISKQGQTNKSADVEQATDEQEKAPIATNEATNNID